MNTTFVSLIEGYWRIFILLLFMIEFNPSDIYALFYVALKYSDTPIFPHLGYCIRSYTRLHIFIRFLNVLKYVIQYYINVRLEIYIFNLYSTSFCVCSSLLLLGRPPCPDAMCIVGQWCSTP